MSKNITVFLNKITYRIMKNDGYISNDLSPVEIDAMCAEEAKYTTVWRTIPFTGDSLPSGTIQET